MVFLGWRVSRSILGLRFIIQLVNGNENIEAFFCALKIFFLERCDRSLLKELLDSGQAVDHGSVFSQKGEIVQDLEAILHSFKSFVAFVGRIVEKIEPVCHGDVGISQLKKVTVMYNISEIIFWKWSSVKIEQKIVE